MNRSKAWIILFFAGIGVFSLGCSRTTPVPVTQVRTPDASETAVDPTATPLPESSPTQTPSPTATLVPSATASPEPTATATPLPTPEPLVGVTNTENAKILSGPATNYAFLGSFRSGFRLEIIGRSQAGDWLVVRIAPEQHGWVAVDHIDIDLMPDDLVVFEAPPVPSPTVTPVPIPEMSVSFFETETLRYVCLKIKGLAPNQTYQIVAQYVRPNGNVEDIKFKETADEKGSAERCLPRIYVTRGTFTFNLYSGTVLLSVLVYTMP